MPNISLNTPHLRLWGKWLAYFAVYFVFCLIFGPHARPDELLFVLTLPLWVLVPYIVFCLIAAVFKLGLIRGKSRRGAVEIGLVPDIRIEKRARTSNNRTSR